MNKIIFAALIIFSGLMLSSCDLTEEAKKELLNKILEPQNPTITSSQLVPTITDQQTLNELESEEPDFNADFSDLEAELNL